MLDACDEAFAQVDVDGSGAISHKEFAALIKRITGDAASKKMLKKLLRLIDSDSSGHVDMAEFLRFAAPIDGDHDHLDRIELERRIAEMVLTRKRISAARQHGSTALDDKEASPGAPQLHVVEFDGTISARHATKLTA